jgi:hypothetical protein
MSLDDMDHFKCAVVGVAEKDYVALERRAAEIRAEFGPRSSEGTWQGGKTTALFVELASKSFRDRRIGTALFDVSINLCKVPAGAIEDA